MEIEVKYIYGSSTGKDFFDTNDFELRCLPLNSSNSNDNLSVMMLENNDECVTRYLKDFSSTKLEFSLNIEDAMFLRGVAFDSMLDIVTKGIREGKEVHFYDFLGDYNGEFVTNL